MYYNSQIPKTIALLIVLGGKMKEGLVLLAQTLGIQQLTAAQMGTATDAVAAADNAFNAARSAEKAAFTSFHEADGALTAWLGKARATLTTFFGTRWNTQWAQAGFTNGSTSVPSTIGDRLALALRVVTFLTANPSHEAPTLGVTAAIGTALRDAAVNSQQAAKAASTLLKQRGTERSHAEDALTSLMRLLIGVLGELLDANDPRWQAFGLQIPASLATPVAPQGVTVVANPEQGGGILVSWEHTPLATRFRVRMRIVGLETDYELVASVKSPMAVITDIPVDAAVEIIVQAVNGDRQSVASEPVFYQAAPMARSTATAANGAAEIPSSTPATFHLDVATAGSNGHANGSRALARSN